jgi:hypothetical protein
VFGPDSHARQNIPNFFLSSSFTAIPLFRVPSIAMADLSNLSQLLEASLDPRRNKEGK